MGLFNKKTEKQEIERKLIPAKRIELITDNYHGHADFCFTDSNIEEAEKYYKEISNNIGKDYIFVATCKGNKKIAINLKFYAYILMEDIEVDEEE